MAHSKQLGGRASNNSLMQQICYSFMLQLQSTFPNVQIMNPRVCFQQLEQAGVSLYYINGALLNEVGQKRQYKFRLKELQ